MLLLLHHIYCHDPGPVSSFQTHLARLQTELVSSQLTLKHRITLLENSSTIVAPGNGVLLDADVCEGICDGVK